MERKDIAHRTGPHASTILSNRIVVFIKIDDFRHSWIFHGSHGDPMGPHGTPWEPMGTHGNPWIFHEFSGRPRERPTKNVGGCGGGREPPPRISRPVYLRGRNIDFGRVELWKKDRMEHTNLFFRSFIDFCLVSGNMLVRYRGINSKGVLERPWTKLRVLRTISSTLRFQFTVKC